MKGVDIKKLKYLIIIFVFHAIVLQGQEYRWYDERQPESSSQPQEEQQKHFLTIYNDLLATKEQGDTITPNATPIVEGGVDMYVELDYILWHVNQGGLAYAQENVPGVSSPIISNNELMPGNVVSPGFTFNSGFKVGVGLDTDYDGWGVGLTYTWLYSKATSNFGFSDTLDQPSSLTLWESNFSVLPATQNDLAIFQVSAENGNAKWSFYFNAIDLDLGRAFFISPHLILRPHFGVKGTWMKQSYNILYNQEGVTALIGPIGKNQQAYVLAQEVYKIRNIQHAWGVGPRVGLDTTWMFARYMSCFAELSLAGLWGQFTDTRVDTSNVMDLISLNKVVQEYIALNNRAKFTQLMPVIEMQIGFRYDRWLNGAQYRFRLQVGWESQTWLDQNHFIKQGIYGDLGLQGLTANLRLDF